METDQVVLDLASPPLLLPVAVGLRPSYVISGNLSFGWEKGQFKIERLGAMRVKRLLSEPVTDRGWAHNLGDDGRDISGAGRRSCS